MVPKMILIIVAIAIKSLLVSASEEDNCPKRNMTYERCTSVKDCMSYSPAEEFISCSGRNSNNLMVECNETVTDVELCLCRQTFAHVCDTNNDCLDEEFCAEADATKRKICIGCLTLKNLSLIHI